MTAIENDVVTAVGRRANRRRAPGAAFVLGPSAGRPSRIQDVLVHVIAAGTTCWASELSRRPC